MSSLAIGLISAGCIFGGALLGLLLQGLLPEHHLRDTSKDTVKVVAGMIATLSALVLGLLVGSAKSSFDATNTGDHAKRRENHSAGSRAGGLWPGNKRRPRAVASRRCRRDRDVLARGKKCGIGNGRFRKGKRDGDDSGETALTHAGDRCPAPTTLASGADQRRYAASPLAA